MFLYDIMEANTWRSRGVVMFSDQFAKLWLSMQSDYQAYMERELAPDLTEVQLYTLELILSMVKAKPSDLIAHLEISPAAISTLVDRMEKNELLIRERDEHDRRIVWLQVTEKGRNAYERGIEIRRRYFASRLDALSEHNQKLLCYLMGKIAPDSQLADPPRRVN